MSGFDFTGDYPSPVDQDALEDVRPEFSMWFDAKVDYLMNVRGYDRDEAERVALEILMDDAA